MCIRDRSDDGDSRFDSDGSYYDYDEDIYYDSYEIIKAVSYTHLDVYKRQFLQESEAPAARVFL